jgi:hypothetical protein
MLSGLNYAISKEKIKILTKLTNTDTEDMEMCFPEHSSFHLGGNLYLIAEQDGILLTDKNTMSDIYFPLVRWVQLQTTWGYIYDAVHYLEPAFDLHLSTSGIGRNPRRPHGMRGVVCHSSNNNDECPGVTLDSRFFHIVPIFSLFSLLL